MDNIGDIRVRVTKSGYKYKQTLIACEGCGIGRWGIIKHGKPERPMCRKCSTTKNWKDPKVKKKRMIGLLKSWENVPERKKIAIELGKHNFLGKHHTPETIEMMSKPRVKVNIKHTWEWGYFIGLVLGDGWLSETKKSYKIGVSSTRIEIVEKFYNSCIRLNIHCCYYKTGVAYIAEVCSKHLYTQLRPYKYNDFHFTIPDRVFQFSDMSCGFLQGFYDAEGGVYGDIDNSGKTIEAWSKHLDNLSQVQELLDMIGIKSYLIKEKKQNISARLVICDYESKLLFKEKVGFRIERKQSNLDNMKEPITKTHSLQTYKLALSMRKRGYSFGKIGKLLNISRDTIYGWCTKKTPRIIGMNNRYQKRWQAISDIVG